MKKNVLPQNVIQRKWFINFGVFLSSSPNILLFVFPVINQPKPFLHDLVSNPKVYQGYDASLPTAEMHMKTFLYTSTWFLQKGWNLLPLRFLELTENGHDDFSTWDMVKFVPVTISRKQKKFLEVPESENYWYFLAEEGCVPSSEWLMSYTQGKKKFLRESVSVQKDK